MSNEQSLKLETVLRDARGVLVEYASAYLSTAERAALTAEIDAARASFEQEQFHIYGQVKLAPRITCAFGDEGLTYRYGGTNRGTSPWPEHLRCLRDRLVVDTGHGLNYALVDWYRDGTDYIGAHSDKITDLVGGSAIVSVSLGAERPFLFRDKLTKAPTKLTLADGSVLWMRATTQKHYKHELPPVPGLVLRRLNITFRNVRIKSL